MARCKCKGLYKLSQWAPWRGYYKIGYGRGFGYEKLFIRHLVGTCTDDEGESYGFALYVQYALPCDNVATKQIAPHLAEQALAGDE